MSSVMERGVMDRKIIRVSGKRQITIPLKFFKQLRFGNEVECHIENNALVVRPLSQDPGEFSVEILKDLVAQGFSGEELVQKFAEQSNGIKKAIGAMLEEADEIASGKRNGAMMSDVFGDN